MSLLLTKEDIIFDEAKEGDYVMYYVYNAKTKTDESAVGIMGGVYGGADQVLITGTPRYREQILFVLTHEGYMKQKRFTNPLAY